MTSSIISSELRRIKPLQIKPIPGTEDDSKRIALTRNLIKSKSSARKGEFHDPSNTKLDLSKSNKVLFNLICKQADDRMKKRYKSASQSWIDSVERITKSKIHVLANSVQQAIRSASISPSSAGEPIAIGDLVTMFDDNVDVYIVVSVPESLSSSSYTVINFEGNIMYTSKNAFKYRFPGVINKKFHRLLQNFVRLERKYLDIAPIGVTDSKFSRSEQSLPIELQSSDSTSKSHDKSSLVDTDIGGGQDFLVAQASSQLLTNTNVNTYNVPLAARQIYSKALTDISIRAFNETSEISAKLEVLYRYFQYDDNGDLINSPRTISLFDMLHSLQSKNMSKIKDMINEKKSPKSFLGKKIPDQVDSSSQKYPVSTYLALLLAIKKQSRLWTLQQHGPFIPVSVTISPIKNIELTKKVLRYLKFEHGDKDFSEYCLGKISGKSIAKPKYYDEIVQMFKNYIVGNFNNDPAMETLLVSILRLVDTKLNTNSSIKYTYEYSRSRSYDLLAALEGSGNLGNPTNWSTALALPNNDISVFSDLSDGYFKYIDEALSEDDFKSTTNSAENPVNPPPLAEFDQPLSSGVSKPLDDFYSEDPLASIREDFGSIPIYCIDSADAHEIDDGVAIKAEGDKYVISIHIANPTSYVKPNSTLSSIALNKATTTYLPEGPTMMLPNLIGKIAGLGRDGVETRTFAIQYQLDKKTIDDYTMHKITNTDFQLSKDILESVLKQIDSTIEIKVCKATNFPMNYTYDKVSELLNDKSKIDAFARSESKDEHFDNLFKLYNIATIFNDVRLIGGNGILFIHEQSKLKVVENANGVSDQVRFERTDQGYELTPANSNHTIIKLIGNQELEVSKSETLVTQLMISANYSVAKFGRQNKIGLIYRNQAMKLHPNVTRELKEIFDQQKPGAQQLSTDELSKILTILSPARLDVAAKPHESLGIDGYAWSTSPLRRYVDMVNHWNLEKFLLEKATRQSLNKDNAEEEVRKLQLQYSINHLQDRILINKKFQKFSDKFWEGIFLREYMKLFNCNKVQDPIKFRLLIKTDAKMGNQVSVDVIGFNNLRGKLDITPELMEEYHNNKLQVGHIFESPRLKITTIDFIEDELVFEYR
jgi:exoribonuclease II